MPCCYDAVADDANNVRPADARRDEVQLEFTAVIDHGVPGVVATSITDYAIGLTGKVVNHLPLALISPLCTDYGVGRHYDSLQVFQKYRREIGVAHERQPTVPDASLVATLPPTAV